MESEDFLGFRLHPINCSSSKNQLRLQTPTPYFIKTDSDSSIFDNLTPTPAVLKTDSYSSWKHATPDSDSTTLVEASRCCFGVLLALLSPVSSGLQKRTIGGAEPYGLPLNLSTLPQFLNGLHYTSRHVGKWHLGFYQKEFTPTYRGFESHYGYWSGRVDYYDHTADEHVVRKVFLYFIKGYLMSFCWGKLVLF